jgi:uncharacterized protein with NAD-binding domain and iron-sulfur cluster
MKDQEILNNAPDDALLIFSMPSNASDAFLAALKALMLSTTPRSLADIKELVQLRQENADLQLKTCTLDLTKGHLSQCEEALESRDELNDILKAKIVNLENRFTKTVMTQEEKNKTFYHDAPCMFDNLTTETRNQVTMLSCNCPKCTVR